ncbi:FAD-binding oxidoreductase [Roseomonas sp. HF4]|uniref:NAD(P)/FAD-dependent oxidoreductase n=1 Tax=Roseomonas sp. HF4 TaxID=2562313 RepID=UPI0010BFEA06|nr:FAD-dependent oxidoreductase [Roseomonas sp. HF4]
MAAVPPRAGRAKSNRAALHAIDAIVPLKLRTGVPVWLADGARAPASTALVANLKVDVAVIGGGISGALVTDALLQAGLSVAVFDRIGFVRGSTPASTAMLQFEIDQPLTTLGQRIGTARAARAWWRSASGVARLQARIADLGLRCDFRERHTAYLPGTVLDLAGLRREAAARERIGLRSVLIDRAALLGLTGIDKPGAIWSAGSAEVDPAKLARGLWRSAAKRGAMLHAPVEVIDIAPGKRRVTLGTDTGHGISAGSVVLATGYALTKLLKPPGYRIISTWAMATAPQPDALWPSRCLIWEASDPYLYCRTMRDGRVVAGGEDAAFEDDAKRDALIPAKVARIGRKLQRLLPMIDTAADFAWAGCFGESSTGLPAIGAVPGAPRCYAVMGFGGNGITFSAIAAEMVQRAILGLPDPDADLFGLG